MKFVGCGLLDTEKVRIGAAGLDKSLKCFRSGKPDAKVLHRSGTLSSGAQNVVSIKVGKEMELVVCCLLVAEDEAEVMLARLGWQFGRIRMVVGGWMVAGGEADDADYPLVRKLAKERRKMRCEIW